MLPSLAMSKRQRTITQAEHPTSKRNRMEGKPKPHCNAYNALTSLHKEIRILLVKPGDGEEPIHCTFRQAFLEDGSTLNYETISYVWGDASIRATVFLDGQAFDVPASSEKVLRRMRYENQVRELWIDAICINQNNLQERNQQVAIMGDIYSKCTTNLIWLGDDDGTTRHALESIQTIIQEMRSETVGFTELKDLFYPSGTIATCPSGLQSRVRESALRRLLESSWFSRVWVVQEAALAPQSLCFRGDHTVNFLEVMQAILWIRYKSSEGVAARLCTMDAIGYVCSLADWTVANGGYHISRPLRGRTLAALLASFRESKAQDPRDHVFALVGLWLARSGTAELPPELTPDYSASLADVLTQATRFAIRERGDLEILKLVSHQPNEHRLSGLPSWAPRWDAAVDLLKDPSMLVHRTSRADAGVAVDIEQILQDRNCLTVRGFVIGSCTSDLLELRRGDSKSIRRYIERVEHVVRQVHQGDTHSLYQVVGTVLQAGTTSLSSSANEQESGRAYEIYKRALINIDSAYPYHVALAKMSAEARKQIAAQFAIAMTTACYDRKFFSATGGHLGLGPKTIKKGDVVAVIYGSPFPVILRSLETHVGDHELIGVCYVYGDMNGEAVEKHNKAGHPDVLYQLR